MKPVLLIIPGVVGWIFLSLTTSLWIYQYNVHFIFTLITLFGSIHWLTLKQNRTRLRKAFSTQRLVYDGLDGQRLLDYIAFGLVAIFVSLVLAIETSKLIVTRSEGYSFIKASVSKSHAIQEKVGEVSFITVRNGFTFHHSWKESNDTLKANLLVFGSTGQIEVDAAAVRDADVWTTYEIRIAD
jgi:hypothetical protein